MVHRDGEVPSKGTMCSPIEGHLPLSGDDVWCVAWPITGKTLQAISALGRLKYNGKKINLEYQKHLHELYVQPTVSSSHPTSQYRLCNLILHPQKPQVITKLYHWII